jgi:hypothetical protein
MHSPSSRIPSAWEKVPKVATRSELLELRRKENLPDISYDLDGDGVVSGKDYYLGKRFDVDGDGRLNSRERAAALTALQAGLDNSLVWGCDSSGINRSFRIVQKRGNVILNEEFTAVQNTYPSFPAKDTHAARSKSELDKQRKEEVMEKGKWYEKKITKEYRVQVTDLNYREKKRIEKIEYQEMPKFRTKGEMVENQKRTMVWGM